MAKQIPLLPVRFRLDEQVLHDYQVAVLDFPWQAAFDRFIDGIEQIRQQKLEFKERPPYRQLNLNLVALAPPLVHAFERFWDKESKQARRQMLVLGNDPALRPPVQEIGSVVGVWAKQWVNNCFDKEVDGPASDLYDELIDSLNKPQTEWRVMSADELWNNPAKEHNLLYRAIPSLICARLNGEESVIKDKPVKWRLAHDGRNGFVVVSHPQYSSYLIDDRGHEIKGGGLFAYKLEFRVQTQAGENSQPWIHLYVRCQRYADKQVTKKNRDRDVSILVGVNKPRLAGFPHSPTLVTLPVTGYMGKLRWAEGVADLLDALKARGLIDPNQLLQNPKSRPYESDEYLVVHTEGLKYGRANHGVKTGFNLRELRYVVAEVARHLQDILTAGQPLLADHAVQSGKRPLAMMTFADLAKPAPLMSPKEAAKKGLSFDARREKRETDTLHKRREGQTITSEACKRALNGEPVQISVCWKNARTRDMLVTQLREVFLLNDGDSWPSNVEIVVMPETSAELAEPLALGRQYIKGTKKEKEAHKRKWDKQRRKLRKQKRKGWKKYLQQIPGTTGYQMALIELDPLAWDQKESQNIKGIVRKACVESGIASQMINPIKVTQKGKVKSGEQSKAQNAALDLVCRQSGLLYDVPCDIYQKAGVPSDVANNLTVVALYHRKANKTKTRPGANYAMAVRLLPDGRVEGMVPYGNGWQPYLEASLAVGRAFAARKSNLEDSELSLFAADVLTQTEGPTLALLNAVDWRTGLLPQLANPNMRHNELDFSAVAGYQKCYNEQELEGLRVIRLRQAGSLGETPQYVATPDTNWADIEQTRAIKSLFGAGFEDVEAGGEFVHYFSIGKQPKTVSKLQNDKKYKDSAKADAGGAIAFKHQTIVELVPFFLQSGDEPLAWCRVAHYLRFSPTWNIGHTLPYVYHLAHNAVQDQICLLGFEDGK